MTKTIDELNNLNTKTAIITGGSKGIGLAIAKRLHEAGANVAIADIDAAATLEAAEQLNMLRADSAIGLVSDVSSQDDVDKMSQKVIEQFGGIDVLINNAGIFPYKLFLEADIDLYKKVLDINLVGAFLCSQVAAKQMIKQGGGKIINVTSVDALHPSMTGLAHYDASKHGLWGFTKNIALELAPHNIAVNALAPGSVTTPGVEAMGGSQDDTAEAASANIPLGRFADADEIATVALFLASGMSSYMTGSQIVVDGGLLLK